MRVLPNFFKPQLDIKSEDEVKAGQMKKAFISLKEDVYASGNVQTESEISNGMLIKEIAAFLKEKGLEPINVNADNSDSIADNTPSNGR